MVDMATVCSSGVVVPVYTNLTPDQIRYIINDSQARFLVCSNLKLWQKIASIRPELPLIEKFILMEGPAPAGVMSLEEVEKSGEEYNLSHPDDFDRVACLFCLMTWPRSSIPPGQLAYPKVPCSATTILLTI